MAPAHFVAASNGTSNVTVHFIDVGQGDSIFIDTPNIDVLVDGGPQKAGSHVLSYLSNLGTTHINLIVATHMHEDHIGGLVTVLSSTIQVDEILVNNQTESTAVYTNFMTLAHTHTMQVAQRGQSIPLTATANLTILNPVQPLEFDSENDNSVVMRLQAGNTSFLLTGDASADAENSILTAGVNLKSNVLKVGHHGSRYATTNAFLNAVSPSTAIISAGINNSYGHPHPETIERLLSHGVTIYGTYQSGTIVAITDGTTITFQNSPQSIPEFPAILIMPSLMILTLSLAMTCKKHITLRARSKLLKPE
jgi:beta-lactamase superfamily II metal-dependent hydrolase